MTVTKTAPELLPVIGARHIETENWIKRIELSTEYLPAVRGTWRKFTRENALELGFITGIVRAGMPPSAAAAYARNLVKNWKHQSRWRDWLIFRSGNPERAEGISGLDEESIVDLLRTQDGAPVLALVHLREIAERVDRLFAEQEEEA